MQGIELSLATAVPLCGRELLQRGEPPQRAPLETPPTDFLKKAAAFLRKSRSICSRLLSLRN
jgi:hypothetical protein